MTDPATLRALAARAETEARGDGAGSGRNSPGECKKLGEAHPSRVYHHRTTWHTSSVTANSTHDSHRRRVMSQ